MLFKFKNIGIVENAEIKIEGLTILTGLNDSGKSFISKGIFSVIKTIKDAEKEVLEQKSQEIQKAIRQIVSLQRLYNSSKEEDTESLRPTIGEISSKINQVFQSPLPEMVEDVKKDLSTFNETLLTFFQTSKLPHIIQFSENARMQLSKSIKAIIENITNVHPENDLKIYFEKVIIPQLFKNQINYLNDKNQELRIEVCENEQTLLDAVIKNSKVEKFIGSVAQYLSDSVYIESPTSIQSMEFTLNALAFGGSLLNAAHLRIAGLPYHIYDLIYKIANNADNVAPNDYQEVVDDIRRAIGGKLFFDPAIRSIVLERNNSENVLDFNIASGIKGLGILDLLLTENIVNSNTLLIIDEPEVHLHPKWEVEYGRILVKLSRHIPILISSHSPSLLSTLPDFIKQYETEKTTHWYFGSKNQQTGRSNFKNVTDDFSEIFTALSDPIRRSFI